MIEKDNKAFLFNKSNYTFLIIGVVLNVIGFLLMIGGAAENLNDFNPEELFSPVRLTVAPILILLGYAVIIYSIMKKPKAIKNDDHLIEQ
jgi:heme/copper-type cytochrome/quinol oxidase subunit 2